MSYKPLQDLKELADIKAAFVESMPDYTKFNNGADLLQALGDDGMKWAAAFCQITKKNLDIDLEVMYVQGWFANAIEHSSDVRRWAREKDVNNPNPKPQPSEIAKFGMKASKED